MSMSVSVVLVRSQPSGFTMSICSVKRFRRSAPRNSGSRWNTVRQFRMLFFTPPFCVPSNVSRTFCRCLRRFHCVHRPFDRFLRFRRHALKFAVQAATPPFPVRRSMPLFLLFLRITKYPKVFCVAYPLQRFHKKRMPDGILRLWGVCCFPMLQQAQIIA